MALIRRSQRGSVRLSIGLAGMSEGWYGHSREHRALHYWDNGKEMESTIVYWGNIGITEKKMEATIVYWGNIG